MTAVEEAADRSVLAIDLGGTQIRAAHVSPDLAVSCSRARGDPMTRRAWKPWSTGSASCAARVREPRATPACRAPIGVGISSPGPLDPWRGVVVAPPNLAGWRDIPLARRGGGGARAAHVPGAGHECRRDGRVALRRGRGRAMT